MYWISSLIFNQMKSWIGIMVTKYVESPLGPRMLEVWYLFVKSNVVPKCSARLTNVSGNRSSTLLHKLIKGHTRIFQGGLFPFLCRPVIIDVHTTILKELCCSSCPKLLQGLPLFCSLQHLDGKTKFQATASFHVYDYNNGIGELY